MSDNKNKQPRQTDRKKTYVQKRNGKLEQVSFDKVKSRIENLCDQEPPLFEVDSSKISIEVINRIYDGVTTTELDAQAARICANMVTKHPEYGTLASRLVVSNHQKNTCVRFLIGEDEHTRDRTFAETMDMLYLTNDENGDHSPIINKTMRDFAMKNSKHIEKIIDYRRDYDIDFFGFKTLERAYLLKIGDDIMERPQHMWMRVAIVVTNYDLNYIPKTYNLLSNGMYTHATPTLFNSGTVTQQLSSCFLVAMSADSLDGIYETLWSTAKISKRAGGIGIHLGNLRSRGALIRGTNGRSLGIMPVLKLYNASAELINQGGKRKGSYAMYFEPWHPDIFSFIEAKRGQTGEESSRALDLFYALWIPDRFMHAVVAAIEYENKPETEKTEKLYSQAQWYLMDPDKCPGLQDVYGDDFEELYQSYVDKKMYKKQIYVMDLWKEIVTSQIESGVPYMLYKDACNKKSNQQNLGTIKSSNLCVSGDTRILTDNGYIEIKELMGTEQNVWNGFKFTTAKIRKTNQYQPLLRVTTKSGLYVDVSRNHKFCLEDNKLVKAKELKVGDSLRKCEYPVIHTTNDPRMANITTQNYVKKLQYIRNVYTNNPMKKCYEYNPKNIEDRREQLLILQTIGIQPYNVESKIVILESQLNSIQLSVNATPSEQFASIPAFNSEVVESIELLIGIHDTYCFAEQELSMGMFSGIYTHNCSEIIEFSDEKETAVCNLCSIAVNKYVDRLPFPNSDEDYILESFNHELLLEHMETYVRNMDNVIDANDYPTEEGKRSNMRHRPIGIGIQGLADTFFLLRVPFDSDIALKLDREIFETIYYGYLKFSCKLAQERGKYESFDLNGGCPLSKGLLQFDLWENFDKSLLSGRYDWDTLREDIKTHGVRNSLGLCCMPTASSSQILGNVECIEPIKSNVFKRRTLAGEFVVLNKYLVQDLIDAKLWSYEMKQRIIAADGSIQDYPVSVPMEKRDPKTARFPDIPKEMKNLYKTVWEMKQRVIIDHAGPKGRGPFIDQSQSMNLFFEKPTAQVITRAHIYGWREGLKTGSYYIRTRAAASALKFTVSVNETNTNNSAENHVDQETPEKEQEQELICHKEDGCWHCSA